jgi:hypothetical protein
LSPAGLAFQSVACMRGFSDDRRLGRGFGLFDEDASLAIQARRR